MTSWNPNRKTDMDNPAESLDWPFSDFGRSRARSMSLQVKCVVI